MTLARRQSASYKQILEKTTNSFQLKLYSQRSAINIFGCASWYTFKCAQQRSLQPCFPRTGAANADESERLPFRVQQFLFFEKGIVLLLLGRGGCLIVGLIVLWPQRR